MFKKLSLAAVALVACAGIGLAAGNFANWPIVGSASYCAGTENTPGTCSLTVPAGPTAITGNELIPMDTNLAQGMQPQTVLSKPASLGIGPYVYEAPLTGVSITMAATTRSLIIEPAGTIATHTVVLPASTALVDGQAFGLCATQIITALTITPGAGTTVSNTQTATIVPLGTGAAACPEWIYRQANTTWYRIH